MDNAKIIEILKLAINAIDLNDKFGDDSNAREAAEIEAVSRMHEALDILEEIEKPEVLSEGYSVLMELHNGIFEFSSFTENENGDRVLDIFKDKCDAHLDMLEYYKDCVEAVKEGNMEDFEYDCIVAFVQEFEDEYVAFDDNGTEICRITKEEINE